MTKLLKSTDGSETHYDARAFFDRPRNTRRGVRALFTRTVLAGLTLPAAYAARNETHVFGVEESCAGKHHSIHIETADKFADHFNDLASDGLWDDVERLPDAACMASFWTDDGLATSAGCTGADNQDGAGADDADVVFIHSHGGHLDGYYSSLVMGTNTDPCKVYTNANMKFDDDLQIAVIKACQGGNYEAWYDPTPAVTSDGMTYRRQFTNTTSAFTMWNAFHGNSSCGTHVKNYVDDYARNSDSNGVGENWIDEAYDEDGDSDDCPVSIVMGSSSSVRETMYEYGGWRDRKDTGSKSGSSYFYIEGCNPGSGMTLP